jgi:hypothetical protein
MAFQNFRQKSCKTITFALGIFIFTGQCFAAETRFAQILNSGVAIMQIDFPNEEACRKQEKETIDSRFVCSATSAVNILPARGTILDTNTNNYTPIHMLSEFDCEYFGKPINASRHDTIRCEHIDIDSTNGRFFQIFNDIEIIFQIDFENVAQCNKEYLNTANKSTTKCTGISAAEIMKSHGKLFNSRDNTEVPIHANSKIFCNTLASAFTKPELKMKMSCD